MSTLCGQDAQRDNENGFTASGLRGTSLAAAGNLAQRMRHHVTIRGGPAKDDDGNIICQNGAWVMMIQAADEIDTLRYAIDDLADLASAAMRDVNRITGMEVWDLDKLVKYRDLAEPEPVDTNPDALSDGK